MFRFKQFTIHQHKTAMKVCTDACIFGAYIDVADSNKILDVGAGTGLLSLMVAQKSNAKIDAVEIDDSAYNQALDNIAESPFHQSINLFHQSIQEFTITSDSKYDLIISNPPFYQNSLKSPDNQANKAHHAETLTFEELISSIIKLLKIDGKVMILLPSFEMSKFIEIAQNNNLYIQDRLQIRHSSKKKVFREVCTFTQSNTFCHTQNELIIFEDDHKSYSNDFRELLKDYYLIF